MMRMILMLLAMFALSGCSNKAVYDNIQLHKRRECSKLPPSQYDDCMGDARKSYDEYERERNDALKQ